MEEVGDADQPEELAYAQRHVGAVRIANDLRLLGLDDLSADLQLTS
jgi:hypothetical protein